MYSIFLSIYTSINICILIEDDKIYLKKLFSSTKMKGLTKGEEIFYLLRSILRAISKLSTRKVSAGAKIALSEDMNKFKLMVFSSQ